MESYSRKEKLIFDNNQGQTLEISVLSPFYLDSAEGLDAMENEFFTSKSYGIDGLSLSGSSVKERNIVINGRLRIDKDINRSRLIRFFNPKHVFTLQYTNGEISRYIKCHAEKTPVINKAPYPEFMISLLCPKPWWFDNEIKTDIASWIGGFSFPLVIPADTGIRMGYREPSLIVNVLNASDNEAPLRLEYRALGTLRNPSVVNVETQEKILIEKEMQAGDIITISTERGNEYVRLSRNGIVSNIFNYLSFDSNPHLALDLGDNLLRYDAGLNVDNLEVSIYFTPQYVGV
ncbi:phage tail family protein [Bacillus sp. 1P06AnD]|uniref:phage tail family protein n=1 Tax=Bacillus sp. 1P06AnD TaxID=3132208 RepID=UPI00399EED28